MVIYAFSLSLRVRACFFIYLSQICLCFIPEANIQIFFFTLQTPLIALISSPLGILVAAKVESIGLGGSMNIFFVCNNCNLRKVNFQGSAFVEGSKRTVIGLALAVAFFVTGHGFAKFNRTLNQCLGISALSKNRYYDVVKTVYPAISDILNEV